MRCFPGVLSITCLWSRATLPECDPCSCWGASSLESSGQTQVLRPDSPCGLGLPAWLFVGKETGKQRRPLSVCSFLQEGGGLRGSGFSHLLLLGIRNEQCPERDFNQKGEVVMDSFIFCPCTLQRAQLSK